MLYSCMLKIISQAVYIDNFKQTIFLCAWDHILNCIYARTFKLGMKYLSTISRGLGNLTKFKHQWYCACTLYSCSHLNCFETLPNSIPEHNEYFHDMSTY